jgi:hypothetical protein
MVVIGDLINNSNVDLNARSGIRSLKLRAIILMI